MKSGLSHIMLLVLLPGIVLISGCAKENLGDCVKSTGSIRTEFRIPEPFNRLEVEDNINVFIYFDDSYQLEIEAGKNLIPLIETEVKNGTLYLRNNNKCNWVRSFEVPVNVHLTCPSLDYLIARGFGTIETVDTIVGTSFTAEQWEASGLVKLTVNTQQTWLKTNTGPGNFECYGITEYLYAYNSSSGIFRLENLYTNECFIWNAGVGDIHVQVGGPAEFTIDDAGDIYYTGSPHTVISHLNGSGQLIPF